MFTVIPSVQSDLKLKVFPLNIGYSGLLYRLLYFIYDLHDYIIPVKLKHQKAELIQITKYVHNQYSATKSFLKVSYVHIPFFCITYEMIKTYTQAVNIYIIHLSEMRLTFCFYPVNILCCIIHISFKHIAFRQICIDHCQSADIALILRSRHVSCVCAQEVLSGLLIHSGIKIQIPNINFNTSLYITYIMLITALKSQHIIFQCRDRITLRYRYYRHKIICSCLQPPLLRAFQINESIGHHIKHIIKIILYIICCT